MTGFLQQVKLIGWLTRFDLAVDDHGARYFTVEDLRGFLDRQDVVSKFRTYRDVYESTFTNESTGHTLYFGSRQSEVMLRVYDKQLQQNQKAASPMIPTVPAALPTLSGKSLSAWSENCVCMWKHHRRT